MNVVDLLLQSSIVLSTNVDDYPIVSPNETKLEIRLDSILRSTDVVGLNKMNELYEKFDNSESTIVWNYKTFLLETPGITNSYHDKNDSFRKYIEREWK